jgi:tetratricopeptide (TPR) repeat protein
LKHELVHVINLQQTHFNITHWFTEGLAVSSENHPRPAEWNQLLKSRLPKGKLFNLDTIETGFTRPDASGDWAMAYCQAELYVDYMRKLGGEAAIAKMIDAYAQGANTEEALRKTFNMAKADFEKGYLDFVAREVEKIKGLRWANAEDIAELKKTAEERPQDAGAQAELAGGYLYRGAEKEAVEQVEKSLKLEPGNPLAIYVKARLLLKVEKKNEEAIELLEKAIDLKSPEPNGLNLLAGLKLKAERYEEAARLYALGEKLDSANPQWARSLARVYLATENKEKLAETLARVAEADVDDLSVRKKLAQLAIAKRDYASAQRWAGEALEIDLRDAESHAALAESLGGGHNNEGAIEEWKIAVELAPEKPQPRFALADAYYQTGQKEKAKEELEKLLDISPDYSPAKTLLESIEKEDQ